MSNLPLTKDQGKASRKVLVVDDAFMNRVMLEDMLSDSYDVEAVEDGSDALERLEDHPLDYGIVLLDLNMPKVSGFAVLEKMTEWELIDKIPVIVITGDESYETEMHALALGATDFVRKPFDARVVSHRVKNTFDLFAYKHNLEDLVAEQTKDLRKSNKLLREQADRIQQFNENTIDLLGMVVEYRHTESGQHVQRVKAYTELLCKCIKENYPEYGLTDDDVFRIAQASVLHDLGKIAIPDSVLLKPGRLTDDEYNQMKNHTIYGYELVSQIKGAWDDDFATIVRQICRHHHERYDGKGYPDGLAGEDIPIAAQAVSVADVYDALVTDRVYKAAYTPEVAYNMIQNNECGVFSPKLMKCLELVRPEFEEIVRNASFDDDGLHSLLLGS